MGRKDTPAAGSGIRGRRVTSDWADASGREHTESRLAPRPKPTTTQPTMNLSRFLAAALCGVALFSPSVLHAQKSSAGVYKGTVPNNGPVIYLTVEGAVGIQAYAVDSVNKKIGRRPRRDHRRRVLAQPFQWRQPHGHVQRGRDASRRLLRRKRLDPDLRRPAHRLSHGGLGGGRTLRRRVLPGGAGSSDRRAAAEPLPRHRARQPAYPRGDHGERRDRDLRGRPRDGQRRRRDGQLHLFHPGPCRQHHAHHRPLHATERPAGRHLHDVGGHARLRCL